jgi:hypothetical protein
MTLLFRKEKHSIPWPKSLLLSHNVETSNHSRFKPHPPILFSIVQRTHVLTFSYAKGTTRLLSEPNKVFRRQPNTHNTVEKNKKRTTCLMRASPRCRGEISSYKQRGGHDGPPFVCTSSSVWEGDKDGSSYFSFLLCTGHHPEALFFSSSHRSLACSR